MIISHKHKFIFIKTFKTAGTSLEVFLSSHCGEDDVITPIFPHIEPHVARNYQGYFNPFPRLWHCRGRRARRILRELIQRKRFYGHMNGQVIRGRIPAAIWNSYFKFCVERNPWEKALSYYHMKNYRAGGKLTLEQYFARCKFRTNFEKYTDGKGCLLVDEVIRYEELAAGLGRVFERLGIPYDGSLGIRAKSEYRSDRRPYSEVLTDAQIEIIARAYAPEIRMHGYQP